MPETRVLVAAAQAAASACVAATAVWVARSTTTHHLPTAVHAAFGLWVLAFVLLVQSGEALLGVLRLRTTRLDVAPPLPLPSAAWHALETPAVLAVLGCNASGLSDTEAAVRLREHGLNELAKPPAPPPLVFKLLEEVHEPTQQLLQFIGVLFAFFGERTEAVFALSVIAAACVAETATEARAKAAVRSLARAAPALTLVLRSGGAQSVPTASVVTGDVLLLRAGYGVPADARVLTSRGLAADEATLTGESVPSAKGAAACAPLTPLAERHSVVHAGTRVVRGSGTAVVVATGAGCAGSTAAHATSRSRVKQPMTAHQAVLSSVAGWLTLASVAAAVAATLLGHFRAGAPWPAAALSGLALAFATVPEELPLLAAAVLALGSARLAARCGAFATSLRALERLADVDTVLADKTGTLTTGTLRLAGLLLPAEEGGDEATSLVWLPVGADGRLPPDVPAAARAVAAWDASAEEPGGGATTDPFELAVDAARRDGRAPSRHHQSSTAEICFIPFDATTKVSGVVHADGGGAIRGAPDALLRSSKALATAAAQRQLDAAAAAGLRTLGVARLLPLSASTEAQQLIEDAASLAAAVSSRSVVLSAVFCFEDPLRIEARAAVAACSRAGVRVLVATGDLPATAAAAAAAAGITSPTHALPAVHCGDAEAADPDGWAHAHVGRALSFCGSPVFARATPAHKVALVLALQSAKRTVLVTGDGANDAPALSAADVGVAAAGAADAARAAAGVSVLPPGDLGSVAAAIEQGRSLRSNLCAALAFYLGCKLAVVCLFAGSLLASPRAGAAFPLTPTQVLLAELYMDCGASLAFVALPPGRKTMREPPPRHGARLFDRKVAARTACVGATMLIAAGGGYVYGQTRMTCGGGLVAAQTCAFISWMLAQVPVAFFVATGGDAPATPPVAFAAWAAAAAVFVAAAASSSSFRRAAGLSRLAPADWAAVFACAWGGVLAMQLARLLLRNTCVVRADAVRQQAVENEGPHAPLLGGSPRLDSLV